MRATSGNLHRARAHRSRLSWGTPAGRGGRTRIPSFSFLERGRLPQERSEKGTLESQFLSRTAGFWIPRTTPPDSRIKGKLFRENNHFLPFTASRNKPHSWRKKKKIYIYIEQPTQNQTQNLKKSPNNNDLLKSQADQATKKPQSGGNSGGERCGAASLPGCSLRGRSWHVSATPRSPTTGSSAAATHVCAGREHR